MGHPYYESEWAAMARYLRKRPKLVMIGVLCALTVAAGLVALAEFGIAAAW
jgi:hypothetical protein